LAEQHRLFEYKLQQKADGKFPTHDLLLCEHNPVYTLGKHGQQNNLLVSQKYLQDIGAELYRVDRGGDITYHGPGQITGYPIFDLEQFGIGLREYIFRLEEVVIRTLKGYDIKGERISGATGVWIEKSTSRERKICAIGVRSSRYVTMHGFALNVNTDLRYFSYIHPCGFVDKGVTSIEKELGYSICLCDVKQALIKAFNEVMNS